MPTSVDNIVSAIEGVIAARKTHLPAIQQLSDDTQRKDYAIGRLLSKLDELATACKDSDVLDEINTAKQSLKAFQKQLRNHSAALQELEAEFTRDTINIGVSGAARTGKSTTLQHITGLTDQQIPSGGLNPVTAVRSEIFNSNRNKAEIVFRSKDEFINEYICPHVANVNKNLDKGDHIIIGSIAALRAAHLPTTLKGNVSVVATDSLKRLQEAQRSIDSYEKYLGMPTLVAELNDIRKYVTYPSPAEEQAELNGAAPADRSYLAVKLARIYCQFPNLGDAKVGLVDLPGLGEIGNSASKIHLKGLEDKVDQIFLVMRPTKEKAFTDAEVARNLDQLNIIQPAVRRGDLIVAGINKDAQDGQEAADNLRAHFNAEVNKGRSDKGYTIIDYCAIDDNDVKDMFKGLLDRLSQKLPSMDQKKIQFCIDSANIDGEIEHALEQLISSMDSVLRSIPSSDKVMKERIDSIEREVIRSLNAYSDELLDAADSNSKAFQEFVADAQRVHDKIAKQIENGLFRKNNAGWNELTSGSKDYLNLYRDECRRIRYEIIDAYCGLDRYYDTHVSNFKLRVLSTLLRSCGLDTFFNFDASVPANKRIEKVASELGSTLHDDDLDAALRLLADARFDFRSNVFLQIESHLADLANPPINDGKNESRYFNKREILGGIGASEDKQNKLHEFLCEDANKANDAILDALKTEKDQFNRYLVVSVDFFNNYLFGKDEDNFKQVVIRGIIREYKEYVLPDADDASKSPIGILAKKVKEEAIGLQKKLNKQKERNRQ